MVQRGKEGDAIQSLEYIGTATRVSMRIRLLDGGTESPHYEGLGMLTQSD